MDSQKTRNYKEEEKKLYDNLKKNLIESADIATNTLVSLHEQGETIKKIDSEMFDIDENVKKSDKIIKNIGFMRNIFGYFTKKKKIKQLIPIDKDQQNVNTLNNLDTKQHELTTKQKSVKFTEEDELLLLAKRLSMMSNEMNNELTEHNENLEKLSTKVDNTNLNIKRLNKKLKKI
tara:strand:+ start:516 stop:1043 length:528 start_codon:yes stop_codon:yes gene_type:complete